jgi:adenosylhomocysteine nucleosidase
MKIVIITAMPEESRAALKAAGHRKKSLVSGRKRYCSQIAGHDIVLVEGGMGMLNAGWAAMALATDSPDLMISAGFGGAVLPGLPVGGVVMAEQVLQLGACGFEEIVVGFFGHNRVADTLGLTRATFISCNEILDKRTLSARLPNNVVNPVLEMETAAVARVAASHGIPFLAIRSVSDSGDEELEFSIDEFCDDSMRIRPSRVFATILARPRIIPQLIRLARSSRVAAKSLASAMERLLMQI